MLESAGQWDATLVTLHGMIFVTIAIGWLTTIIPPTPRLIDMAFVFACLMQVGVSCYLMYTASTTETVRFMARASGRHAIRALLSVLYMKCHVSIVMNLIQTLIACWFWTHTDFGTSSAFSDIGAQLCESEVVSWLCISVMCIVTEKQFVNLLFNEVATMRNEEALSFQAQQLEKKEADIQQSLMLVQSMRTIVESFCDFVVELDCELRVVGSGCKQRAFFNKETNGKLFVELLAGDDQKRWETFVEQTVASNIPGCLQITLSHEMSTSEVSVLLVSTGQEHKLPYLLGISIQQTEGKFEALQPESSEASQLGHSSAQEDTEVVSDAESFKDNVANFNEVVEQASFGAQAASFGAQSLASSLGYSASCFSGNTFSSTTGKVVAKVLDAADSAVPTRAGNEQCSLFGKHVCMSPHRAPDRAYRKYIYIYIYIYIGTFWGQLTGCTQRSPLDPPKDLNPPPSVGIFPNAPKADYVLCFTYANVIPASY